MSRVEGVPSIKGFRYPSPGSLSTAVRVPARTSKDEVYDIKQFTRDPRNFRVDQETMINAKAKPALMVGEQYATDGPAKNSMEAVTRYDPTGLRVARTSTFEEFDKAVKAEEPNHLPIPSWWGEIESYQAKQVREEINRFHHSAP
jgi:hypothetical protein